MDTKEPQLLDHPSDWLVIGFLIAVFILLDITVVFGETGLKVLLSIVLAILAFDAFVFLPLIALMTYNRRDSRTSRD